MYRRLITIKIIVFQFDPILKAHLNKEPLPSISFQDFNLSLSHMFTFYCVPYILVIVEIQIFKKEKRKKEKEKGALIKEDNKLK